MSRDRSRTKQERALSKGATGERDVPKDVVSFFCRRGVRPDLMKSLLGLIVWGKLARDLGRNKRSCLFGGVS